MSKEKSLKTGKKSSVKPAKVDKKATINTEVKKTVIKISSSGCKIIDCGGNDCVSLFQDNRYGKNKRVASKQGKNIKGSKAEGYKCSVCGKTQN